MDENAVPADELPPLPTPPAPDESEPEVFAVRKDGATWAVNRRGFLAAGAAGTAAGCGKKPGDEPTTATVATAPAARPPAPPPPESDPASPAQALAHASPVTAVAAVGGRVFTAGRDGQVREWGPTLATPVRVLPAPDGGVRLLAVNRDRSRLAAVTAAGGARVWSLPAGEEVVSFPGTFAPRSAALSDDGLRLYLQDADTVMSYPLRPLGRGEVVRPVVAHFPTSTQQTFVRRPGGFAALRVTGGPGGPARAVVYPFPSGTAEQAVTLAGPYLTTPGYLAAAPGGDLISLVTAEYQLEVWSLREGRLVAAGRLGGPPAGVQFVDDATLIVLVNRTVMVYRIGPLQLVPDRGIELRPAHGEGPDDPPPFLPSGDSGDAFAVDFESQTVIATRGGRAYRCSLTDAGRLVAIADPGPAAQPPEQAIPPFQPYPTPPAQPSPQPQPQPQPSPVRPSPASPPAQPPRTGGGTTYYRSSHYWRPN